MGLSLAGGLFGASSAKKAARAAAREKSEGIQDTSSLITNPFANLGVATKAAEIQMEETDLALASTLDNLRATGASAGGATALAQAALRSKKGIAASIENQEAQNEKMRASGEQQRQQQLRAEQVRLQQADVAGEQFMFGMREQREMQQLDRTAALLGQATQAAAQARADQTQAITGMFGSLAQLAPGAFNPA